MSLIFRQWQKLKSVLGLSLSLAKTNFKVRNEGSFLGIFWYLLEPLVFFIVLFFIRGVILQKPIENYPMYLFIGLIMFNFFNAVTNYSTGIIQSNAGFIKSLKINKEAFVISGVLQFVFSHFFEFIIFIGFSIYFHNNLLWLLFYPFIFFLFCIFIIGVSFILSVIGVYIKDLKNVWSVVTRLLWFVTPIFYAVSGDSIFQKISMWNPLYHFINITREIIVFHRFPTLFTMFLAVFFSLLVFFIGLYIFEKNKNKLAERI
jgi:ABC-type polysaccharide/polyol phosphate export permease